MCADKDSEFAANDLRSKIVDDTLNLEGWKGIEIGNVTEGKFSTQLGWFEIISKNCRTSVCVWTRGRAEVMTLDTEGNVKETDELSSLTLEEITAKVIKHVEKHT